MVGPQRAGRGIRLTPEGRLPADRAAEIAGRVDAAAEEPAAQVGLRAGRVRLAANAAALSTLVPNAAASPAAAHPALELSLVDRHPVEALDMLRRGELDGFRFRHLADDPIHLISRRPGESLADHRDSAWIGGFSPRLGSSSDDMVVVQSLVAAGLGVATLPGLALAAHRNPGIHAATFADPPDPPAVAAVLAALTQAAAAGP
ncbi:DNA-binding transcriptional regulator, LysR family [Amycolatopsis tolypomycina]|uniref:DNA-binding transcriptional regulator, LysR family n=1 Tax=Amycolatopsis tolypomycina TaxID=208445 RepID=A0A1H4V0F3_9PSEU|nr:LysR substrate-binding domain-containing protein [Amycolatopsis tolypomycina]SEC73951.1 DNA-binding transcriptional regulator, LysR family [Amycolatopsis tolypomycina]